MKKDHILFLTHYFPPEVNAPANRTYEHSREWVKEVDVTVVTNVPNHPDGKVFPGYKNRLIQKEVIDGINVVRLWTFVTPNEGFILRSLNYAVYMLMAVIYVLASGIRFDVLIATTPQFFCGLAGKYIAKLRRRPFILELRDLWPESIIAVGAVKNKAVIKILNRLEMGLYKSAGKIVSVTRSFKDNLIERGIDPSKIEIVFNGVSPETFTNGRDIANKGIREFLSGSFNVGYIGTIGMAHSIKTLIDAAERLKDRPIKIIIVGSGAEREKLEKLIEEKRLENVRIFPLQSKSEVASIIKKLDVFCVHLKNDPLFRTVIPSKIFEGMIMKKPILMGVNGEARTIIESAKGGVYFEPENADDLAEKVCRYYSNESERKLHGENGFRFVIEKFDRKKLAAEYLGIIRKMLAAKSSLRARKESQNYLKPVS
ncbi:MAG TPA: glycosyltransferase family 4 protein [Ignavibacteriales bacterium]|nr:glycosyltransferase family 4 protein [Ignavibacteriales bacterium]